MNGFERVFMGVAWLILGVYGYSIAVVNPNYTTVQMVGCGFIIAGIFIGGTILVGTGIRKVNGK
tara:strand:+ start:542 stop:733 length:192 start_codon:yes stop_codon:yes gene_type:complete